MWGLEDFTQVWNVCLSKNCCTSWLNVPVHCHAEFTVQLTAIFLVICGKLHHRNILVLLNKIYGLQFGLVECIYGAQHHHFDKKKVISITFVFHGTGWAFFHVGEDGFYYEISGFHLHGVRNFSLPPKASNQLLPQDFTDA